MFAYCTWDDDKLDEMKRKLHERSRDLLECVDNVQSSETSVSEGLVNFTSVLSNMFDPRDRRALQQLALNSDLT